MAFHMNDLGGEVYPSHIPVSNPQIIFGIALATGIIVGTKFARWYVGPSKKKKKVSKKK